MKRLIYSVAMSLDGYIAGPNGESDWITMDPDIDFASLMGRFDTYLMGRKTFIATGSGSSPGITTIVVSKTLNAEEYSNVKIISDDLQSNISELKAGSGKDIWLFGGGSLFQSLLDLGLVDLVEVAIVPVILGTGIPFIASPAAGARLELLKHSLFEKSGIVLLEYEVNGSG